jgi:hypothetical protein
VAGSQYLQQSLKPLQDLIGKDQQAFQGVQGLSRLSQTARKKLTAPQVKDSQHIFVGGTRVAAPFNYQWTWNATSGNPTVSVSADSNSGTMYFLTNTDNHNSSSASAAAAVGIFFSPPIEQGNLRISSNPSFSSSWWLFSFFNSSHSDGWIGWYVGRYDLAGNFAGTAVDLQFSLWSEDIVIGDPSDGGAGSMPLQATFSIDNGHFYIIWVWCGGTASGAGTDNFFGSFAHSEMYVTVPSITWELV